MVTCSLEESILNLVVQDDGGMGIDSLTATDSGLGLAGMRERVESLGGIFRVSHFTSGGTRVEMSVVAAEESQDG
jgi:signal transduction histidine kinase